MPVDNASRSFLDQLADAATPPPVPAMFAPAVDSSTPATPPQVSLLPPTDSSTTDLESRAASPDAMAERVAATKQSAKNADNQNPGMLGKIKQFAAGALGVSDLVNPNATPGQKGAAVAGLIGRIGTAGAMAAGTPEQKQLAVEQEKLPLQMAQVQNEMQYRNGMLGVRNQANENTANKTSLQYGTGENGTPLGTSRETAQAAMERAAAAKALDDERVKQLDAQMNGEVVIPPALAVATGHPEYAGQAIPALKAQQQVFNVAKTMGFKTQDLGADGVWGVSPLTGRITRLGDSPSVTRGNAMLLRTQIPITDAQGNTHGYYNPQTNTFTPLSGNPAAAAAAGGEGGVMPPKPTASVLARGQIAQTILPQIPIIQKEVSDLASKIGPGAGRWNEFWVNKGGLNDPDFAGLSMDLDLYASAVTLAHFGASAPHAYVEALQKNFSTAQSPEDLLARVSHAESWLDGYAASVGHGTPSKVPNAASTGRSGAPPANSGGKGSMFQFPDGTNRMVTPDKTARAEALGAKKVQ